MSTLLQSFSNHCYSLPSFYFTVSFNELLSMLRSGVLCMTSPATFVPSSLPASNLHVLMPKQSQSYHQELRHRDTVGCSHSDVSWGAKTL